MTRVLSATLICLSLAAVGVGQERRDVYGDPLPKGAIARLGTTRWRNVNDEREGAEIQFTPDGKSIVCLMPNGSLAGFDVNSGQENWRLRGPRQFQSFAFAPDGKTVFTGDCWPGLLDEPWGVRVWDVANRRQIRLIHGRPVFSIRGEFVAAANIENNIDILNWKTGKLVRALKTTRLLEGTPPMLLPGGKVAASLGYGPRGFEILDYRTGKSLKVVEPEPRPSPFFYPGNIAVAYFDEKAIHRWDLSTGKELPSLSGYGSEKIWNIAVTRDGKTLVAISHESIRRWNLATGKETGRINNKLGPNPMSFAVSDDGRRVGLVCHLKSNLRVFDFEKGGELLGPAAHTEMLSAVHFAQNGRLVVSTGDDETLRLWDTRTGRQILKLSSAGRLDLTGNSYVVNGIVFDLETGRRRFALPQLGDDFHRRFIAPDAPIIATAKDLKSDGTRLELWDAKTGKRRWTTLSLSVADDGILISPGVHLLWSGPVTRRGVSAERLRELNASLEDGSPAFDLATGYSRGNAKVLMVTLALSADGRTLAGHIPYPDESDFSYRELALIEAASGRERLRIDTGPIRDDRMIGDLLRPVFSRDGRLIAAAFPQHAGAIVVFDAASGKLLRRFKGHSLPVTCMEFSPDGTKLISGSADCTAIIWDLSDIAKARKPKTLTAAELDALWKDLASDDAKLAYRAITSLRDAGPQATELIRDRFKPQAIDRKEIERQIADLGSKDKATGDRAQAALQRMAPRIEPLLDDVFARELTPEARRRIEQLLKGISCFETSPERLRELRCVEVLEGIGGDKARAVFESSIEATAHTRLGAEIKSTIERMKGR